MINMPNEITLSRGTTNKFTVIKQRTGVTPNLMGRVALMKALEADIEIFDLKPLGSQGQKISRDIFFGEDMDIYSLAIEYFIKEKGFDGDVKKLVQELVEYGTHLIPTVKNINDFKEL